MALLGTLVDKTTASRAGDALSGITIETRVHSLQTTPDVVIPVLRSVQAVGHIPVPDVLAVAFNASVASIGFAVPSTASAPTVMYDLVSIYFHTMIR